MAKNSNLNKEFKKLSKNYDKAQKQNNKQKNFEYAFNRVYGNKRLSEHDELKEVQEELMYKLRWYIPTILICLIISVIIYKLLK